MTSYVISGANRGLGFAFLQHLSSDPVNTVIGLARNMADGQAKVAPLNRSNVHILKGDLDDYESLQDAANETSKITGGKLDILIANAAYTSEWSSLDPVGVLAKEPLTFEQDLIRTFKTNVVGNVHLFNAFMPLVLKGYKKKVITLTSGLGDTEVAAKYSMDWGISYAVSKAAGNMVVAKYSAQYAKDGVLFMSICPGAVDTGNNDNITEERGAKLMRMFEVMKSYEPSFNGLASPEAAVQDVLAVAEKASVANGDGGSFVSHYGNKQWL